MLSFLPPFRDGDRGHYQRRRRNCLRGLRVLLCLTFRVEAFRAEGFEVLCGKDIVRIDGQCLLEIRSCLRVVFALLESVSSRYNGIEIIRLGLQPFIPCSVIIAFPCVYFVRKIAEGLFALYLRFFKGTAAYFKTASPPENKRLADQFHSCRWRLRMFARQRWCGC